ncbi:MAG: cholest-4-en-3-one 26-monooxygenase [Gammaproteobacteria bacterium]|jgi:cholest-4-en-3-one 26-monooxygenase
MRAEDPVHWTIAPGGTSFWSLFKHAEVKTVLNDNDLFSSEKDGIIPLSNKELEIFCAKDEGFGSGRSIIVTDRPRHTELRKVIEPPFKPKALVDYAARCDELIKAIFDDLPSSGECDIVEDIGAKIPMAVICDVMNIPKEDYKQILAFGRMTLAGADPEFTTEGTPIDTMGAGFRGLREYCRKLAVTRRGCPHQDMLSQMANAEIDGTALSDDELGYNGLLALLAGFETTRNTFSGGVLALLQHPQEMAKLRENPKGIRLAVEEALRWSNAVISLMRVATRDVEVGGKTIKAGERIVIWLASANRDEDVFERADEFDVSRHPNQHIAFGGGAHFCISGPLAKHGLSYALKELLERYDGIELVGDAERVESNFVGGLKRLPVRLIHRDGELRSAG